MMQVRFFVANTRTSKYWWVGWFLGWLLPIYARMYDMNSKYEPIEDIKLLSPFGIFAEHGRWSSCGRNQWEKGFVDELIPEATMICCLYRCNTRSDNDDGLASYYEQRTCEQPRMLCEQRRWWIDTNDVWYSDTFAVLQFDGFCFE